MKSLGTKTPGAIKLFRFSFLLSFMNLLHGAKHSPLPFSHQWTSGRNLTFNVNCDDLASFRWTNFETRYLSDFSVWVLFAEAYSFQNLQSDWKMVHVWYRNSSQSDFCRGSKNSIFSWNFNFSRFHQGSIPDDNSMSERWKDIVLDWIQLPETTKTFEKMKSWNWNQKLTK